MGFVENLIIFQTVQNSPVLLFAYLRMNDSG